MRRDDLIVKDVARNVVADGRTRYDQWCLARAEAREAGAAPTLTVRTAKEWADDAELAPADVDPGQVTVVNVGATATAERAGGAAFGVLVHGVLAQAPFAAPLQQLEQLAAIEARVLGLSEADAAAAARVAQQVLRHDIIARARAAEDRGSCRRETSVSWSTSDGTLVEGIVDLAFEENGRWVIVDYKSDRVLAADGEDRYRRQISLYATAISRTTGLPASGVLVRI